MTPKMRLLADAAIERGEYSRATIEYWAEWIDCSRDPSEFDSWDTERFCRVLDWCEGAVSAEASALIGNAAALSDIRIPEEAGE